MYVCVCNAITEKMLDDNHFLLEKVGSKCGKCLESGRIKDGGRVTYLVNDHEEKKSEPVNYLRPNEKT